MKELVIFEMTYSIIMLFISKQLYWNHTSAQVFSCKFAAYFQKTFSQERFWVTASVFSLLKF